LEAQNRTEITGTVIAIEAMRYTPAGIPIVELTVSHASRQAEAGRERAVELEMRALAAGDAAERLARTPLGAGVRLAGFLAHRGRGRVQLELHIQTFEYIDIIKE
jgi:primosomal replication protein N